ncbi:hypothetical protein EDB19DRAFT_1829957 [Suillus lakei]|nr:hypothetical protein EDB19DRAFT_1829957 [Suillus lakei]
MKRETQLEDQVIDEQVHRDGWYTSISTQLNYTYNIHEYKSAHQQAYVQLTAAAISSPFNMTFAGDIVDHRTTYPSPNRTLQYEYLRGLALEQNSLLAWISGRRAGDLKLSKLCPISNLTTLAHLLRPMHISTSTCTPSSLPIKGVYAEFLASPQSNNLLIWRKSWKWVLGRLRERVEGMYFIVEESFHPLDDDDDDTGPANMTRGYSNAHMYPMDYAQSSLRTALTVASDDKQSACVAGMIWSLIGHIFSGVPSVQAEIREEGRLTSPRVCIETVREDEKPQLARSSPGR